MQNISIKAGTSAVISITPKINNTPVASAGALAGVSIYVFFVYQFTNKVYKEPYELTSEDFDNSTGKMTINLTPSDTIEMLGNAEENQKYELQFAIKTADGNVIAEEKNSGVIVNIIRWEAGSWLHQNQNVTE